MATTYLTLKGRARWAQVYEPEEFRGDTRWKISLVLDGDEFKKFERSGVQSIPKEDGEGNKVVSFRRQVRKVFPKDDEATYWTPPEIKGIVQVKYVNELTGEQVRSFKRSEKIPIKLEGEKINIGNDSVVLVNVCLYDTPLGKGTRLENVTVLDLVEYNPDEYEADEEAEVEDEKMEDKPKPAKKPKEVKLETKNDMDDSIPW